MSSDRAKPMAEPYAEQITFVTDRPGHDSALRHRRLQDQTRTRLVSRNRTTTSGFRKTVQWYLDNTAWTENILSGDYKLERLGV